ncbi:hypothetical protein BDV34DRAFT_229554 [Aspergillus parasiticus]|uniref:Major facilitator superfamily domain-containing protein n=1 Tax=Aspergillus parasiticus TaxID=5067 RepID=A0A5N6D891_ASPPA|nr:hypothetical protein BDV34DRAFT_229554 [Aspergillus parasiticus]
MAERETNDKTDDCLKCHTRYWFFWCKGHDRSLVGAIGCIIISRAQSSRTIIAGFAILGLNFGCQSVILAVLSEILSRGYRPIGQASASVASSLGGFIGLLMGGGLLKDGNLLNYRIFWYIEAGLYAIAALGCLIGVVVFSMALSWSNNPYTWRSLNVLGPFIVGVVAMILFIVYEWRFKKDGMLHYDLWHNRNFAVSLLVIFVEGLSFFAANSYFVYEVMVMYDVNILIAGANFVIMFFAGLLVLGGAFLLLFFSLLAMVKLDTPRYAFWIFPILLGIALVSIVPLTMVSAQLTTSPELITLASALMTTVRSLGGAIGLAINNAVLNGTLNKELPKEVGTAVLSLGLPSSSLPALISALAAQNENAVASISGVTPEIADAAIDPAMKRAYLAYFRKAWIISAAFCSTLVIASCFIKEQKADFDTRIDAPVDTGLDNAQSLPGDMEKSVENSGPKGTSVQHEENVPL